jgi:1,4-alpha-glucan branching enzyme
MEEQGIYYFHQGTNYEAYRLMGAHYTKEATTFRVWAPHASKVNVVGSFNDWSLYDNPMIKISSGGIWEVVIPNVPLYACYQYAITTANGSLLYKSDPYGFHAEKRPDKASKVYDLSTYTFTDQEWMKKRKTAQSHNQPINIYEVHLGSWRKYQDNECFDYKKMGQELSEYCKKMGYTHVEILPISEYPYDPSWGYQVIGYYSVTSRYGTPSDFMDFVNTLHNAKIGVILDWVPSHFGKDGHGLINFDGETLYEHPDPKRQENLGWGTRYFDYGRTEIQSFLVSNAMFYLKEFHIDGLRIDAVSSMLYLDFCREPGTSAINNQGGNTNLEAIAFLKKVNNVIHHTYPEVLTIAEESSNFPKITDTISNGGLGFDYKWNMGWMNDTLSYIENDPIYRQYHHDKITFQLTYLFSEHYVLAISHDEVVHLKKSMIEKMPGNYDQKFASLGSYYTYMMTLPGKKLLFMGQEFGQFHEWDEGVELDWFLLKYPKHLGMQRLSIDLNHLYLHHSALYQKDGDWSGFDWVVVNDKEHNVFGYYRKSNKELLLVILNFAYCEWMNYELPVENGTYEVIFASSDKKYDGYTNWTKQKIVVNENKLKINLPYSCGMILKKE